MMYFTTSWDDGDVLDLKLLKLLDRYNVKGTFYITQKYREQHLSESEICQLAVRHEVGAHTLTHPDLRRISREEKKKEICGSKDWLEHIIEKEIEMFCYPSGLYDAATIEIVRECGFRGARITGSKKIDSRIDVFEMPITLQVYPFPFCKKDKGTYNWRYLLQPWIERSSNLHELGLSYLSMTSWSKVVRGVLDITASHNSFFHLWGHSWEIEKYGMWNEFEELLKYVANIKNCLYLTNGELLKHYNK